jgi:hypothetical protein
MAKPKLEGGSSLQGRGACEIGEIGRGYTKFVPEVGRCVAGETHSSGFAKDCSM